MKEAQKRHANVLDLAPAVEAEQVPVTHRPPGKGRRTIIYTLLGLLVVAGLIFGVQTIIFYLHHVTTDDAQIEGHIDPVLARVSGYVAAVSVTDNQRVAGGQVLVRVDPRDLQAKVNQAEAALSNAQAAVAVARANVEASRSKREKTGADWARAATLFHQRVVSPQEHDTAKAAADSAEAEYQAAVRQVVAAEAQVAQRQADLDYAQLQLSYATVAAPAAGFVSKKNVEVGQFIEAGQPLMAVVQDGGVWVVANFKETQLRKMRVGQPVDVEVDAYPGQVFGARVESIASATGAKFALLPPDNATGNFVKVVQRIPVKIVLTGEPDPNHPLRVGMNVTAIVNVG